MKINYHIGSIFTGTLISVLIFLNGNLSKFIGDTEAVFIMHTLAFLSILAVKLFTRTKFKDFPTEIYLYTGGILSIFIISLETITMKEIGISFTILFLIIGQLVSSLTIDHFGLFGRAVHKFSLKKSIGLVFVFAGIIIINI
ncbi:DMT family transporter [uncultured Ilyobacter sp.]|uniref:DMT family transporter n=1 Tax=uncultured Ilyobacter sp. TaxID=544433 RepID=UPI0029C88606|nr:DMT family transporter [uncultured Ilyobacter sp.]